MRKLLHRVLALGLFFAASLAAAAPYDLPYAGRITAADGSPVAGPVDLSVALSFVPTAGATVTLPPVVLAGTVLVDGLFQIRVPMDGDDFEALFGEAGKAYVEVTDVTHGVTYPKQEILGVPYARKVGPQRQLTFEAANGAEVVLKPAATSSSVTYELPPSAEAGKLLTTDASGKMAWTPGLDQQLGAPLSLKDYAANPGGLTAGKVWYDSTLNAIKYFDGSTVQVLGNSGAGGMNTFNGQTGGTQAFGAIDLATGTAPTWSSAADVHTLRIPMASAAGVTAGLLSKADYDSFVKADGSGNVAIGTTSAVDAVEIVKDLTSTPGTFRSVLTLGDKTPYVSGTSTSGAGLRLRGMTNFGDTTLGGMWVEHDNNPVATNTKGTLHLMQRGNAADDGSLVPDMTLRNGNVGIGTTAPIAKLEIEGNSANEGATDGILIDQVGTGDAALSFRLPSNKQYVMGIDNSDGDKFKIADHSIFGVSDRIVLTSTGDFGIGSAAPTAKLDVAGVVKATSFSTPGDMTMSGLDRNVYVTSTTSGPGGKLTVQAGTTSDANQSGGDLVLSSGGSNGTGASKIDFKTSSGGAPTTSMTILGNGYVGMGTGTPSSHLHVLSSDAATTTALIGNSSTGVAQVILDAADGDGAGNDYFVMRQRNDLSALIYTGGAAGAINLAAGSLTPQVTLDTSGRLGVGTTTPNSRLHVYTSGTTNFIDSETTSGTSNGSFRAINPDRTWVMGVRGDIADGFGIADSTASATRLFIDTSGNVGVGTTGPGDTLHVLGSATVGGSGSKYGTSSMTVRIGAGQSGLRVKDDTGVGSWIVGTDSTNSTQFSLGPNSYHLGNLAIGTATATSRLDVVTDNATNNDVTAVGRFSHTTSGTAANGIGALLQTRVENAAGTVVDTADFGGILTDVTNGAEKGAFVVRTGTAGVLTEKVRVDNVGNVGIGTTNPGSKLEVDYDDAVAATDGMKIVNANTTNGRASGISLLTFDSVNHLGARVYTTGDSPYSWTDQRLTFATQAVGGGNFVDTMSLKNGTVGIGTTSPGMELDLRWSDTGAAGFGFRAWNNANATTAHGMVVRAGSDSAGGATMIAFTRPDSTTIGTITQASATTVAYNTTSDRRLKENVVD